MKLSDSLLPEFDQEMANTRKVLERVPGDKLSWKPHQKSYSMGDLATHLANLPNWATITLTQDSLDMNPPDGNAPPRPQANTREEILQLFEKSMAEARQTIANTSDEIFFKPWSLLSGGKTIFTLPRIVVLRSFVLNHNVHHRAQLGVYLRLNDIPVPAIYGPSADEG